MFRRERTFPSWMSNDFNQQIELDGSSCPIKIQHK